MPPLGARGWPGAPQGYPPERKSRQNRSKIVSSAARRWQKIRDSDALTETVCLAACWGHSRKILPRRRSRAKKYQIRSRLVSAAARRWQKICDSDALTKPVFLAACWVHSWKIVSARRPSDQNTSENCDNGQHFIMVLPTVSGRRPQVEEQNKRRIGLSHALP